MLVETYEATHNMRAEDENMEQNCPEKKTIRFRSTGKSKSHASPNNKRVENIESPHCKEHLSEAQGLEKKPGKHMLIFCKECLIEI